MTTYIPKNPIPSLVDVNFKGFLYTRMAGLMVAMVAMVVMVVMVDTAGRSVTVETGMEVLQCHNWGRNMRERFGPDSPARFRWFEVSLKPSKALKSRCFRFSFLYNYHLFGIRGISLAKPTNNKQVSIEGSN